MVKYILKRLLALIITLFIIISLSFILIHMLPNAISTDGSIPIEIQKVMIKKYGLDKPIMEQYAMYLRNFLRMDFGYSTKTYPGWPVLDLILAKIPVTIILNICSLVITIPLGMLFGIIAAVNKDTWIDRVISFVVILFISVPSFIFASMLQYFLAFKAELFPILYSSDAGLTWDKIHSVILPVLAMSFGGIAGITRYLRAELCENLNAEYMLMATAKGLTKRQAVVRHAIRNSFIPLAGIIIPMLLGIIGGSMVIENIYSIPGMGGLSVSSINTADHYLTMATIFIYTLISLITVLVVDLSYGVIDPRIRMGGGKTSAR